MIACPYCDKPAELVDGSAIYPRRADLASKKFWRCAPCGAHVGCHPGSTRPLGRLADRVLRRAKINAHAAFDPLWKDHGTKRSTAYAWLAKKLGIPGDECHMGMFDVARCNEVVRVCQVKRRTTT